MRYSVGVTAAHLDYVVPMLFPGFAVTLGTMVGASSHSLRISQTAEAGADFNTLVGGYTAADSVNRQTLITRNNFFFYPGVNLEWAFSDFVLVRAGGGYHLSASIGDWTDTEETVVSNVPDIKPDGWMLHFGVFLGLFQR
jgi:hypothetical protein